MDENLWLNVGNICLSRAAGLLNEKTTPTVETVEAVKGLVETAISIDMLNLHWAQQNRYGAEALQDQPFLRKEAGN